MNLRQALDRRELLRCAAGAAAGIVAGGTLASGPFTTNAPTQDAPVANGKKRNLKKALGLGMIGAGSTLEEKFKIVKDLGFDGVEIDCPTKLNLDEILRARDAAGLEIPSVVDSVHWSLTLGDPDPKIRSAGVKELEAALRDAKKVGASSVLLVPCVVNSKITYEDAWSHSQEEIRRVMPLALELQIAIAVENVWNNFIMSPLEARRYIDDFASPWVGWHFDVGNVITYGWPEQWIRTLGKRIKKLHVKEFSRKKRDAEGLWKGFDVKLLEGDNNWAAVMAALDDIGYEGWGIAEVGGGDRAVLKDISDRMTKIFSL